MRRSFINFKTLSVKQLRTSAAVILMSTIAFSALATEIEYEEAIALENWMAISI